jgi:hypothetical protein
MPDTPSLSQLMEPPDTPGRFSGLRLLVLAQEIHQRRRQPDSSSPRSRFRLHDDQAAAAPLWTVGAALALAHPAAAVSPRMALQRAPHDKSSGVQVDVLPLESQRLALPQAKGQRDRPARPVATTG